MKTSCSSECCTSEHAASQQCDCPTQCLTEPQCNCPVEAATAMWAKSFGKAMCEAQTEILKTKILKNWGGMMEQAADAMIETMGTVWAEKIAELKVAEARSAFQSRLRDLWLQEKKK